MKEQVRAWFILGRVSNLPTVWTNVLAAWILNGGGWDIALLWMWLGASMLYVGGTTLNDFFDAAFDREFRQERPIPSGVLSRTAVGLASGLYLALGGLAIGFGGGGAWYWLVLLVAAIVFYDFRHKEWVGSVFVMGACRFFLSLLAASAVSQSLEWTVWCHAGALFAYIVALSLTARNESRPGGPMKSVWFLFLIPVTAPLIAWWEKNAGNTFLFTCVLLLLVAVMEHSLRVLRRGESPARIGIAVSFMLAGIAWLDAAFLAIHAPYALAVGVVGWGAALLLQRVVPAT